MSNEKKNEKLRVIYVEPGKRASVIEIDNDFNAMQNLVGGMIGVSRPFKDDVAIVCNDEGKILGLPLNRGIRAEDDRLLDIIAGDFFICYAPLESEDLLSMPEDLEDKYMKMYDYPEQFFRTEEGVRVVTFDPETS